MYTVIFAGGQGSRLSEETKKLPKPLVKVGSKPIIEHIINHYKKYSFNKFILLTGYKSDEFLKHFSKNENYFVSSNSKKNNHILDKFIQSKKKNKIYLKLFYTGQKTNKLNRLKKCEKILKNETCFFLTYGDGITDCNIKKLKIFFEKNNEICSILAVNPEPRFGLLNTNGHYVKYFMEKKKIKHNYVNAGFMVCSTKIFSYLKSKNKKADLESDVFPYLAKKKKLICYKYSKFWYSMDNLRDKNFLEKLIKSKNAPWL